MTNAQILTAVILKWGEPVIPVMMGRTLSGISSTMLPVEKFLKATGLVGPAWNISGEINSLAAVGGTRVIQPFLERYISSMPDAMIPRIAHEYVDAAIQKGELSILDSYFTFHKEDLVELKKYLDCNLPYQKPEEYVVKIPQSQQPQAQPNGQQNKGEAKDKEEK